MEDQPQGRIAIIEFNRGPDGSNLPTPPGGQGPRACGVPIAVVGEKILVLQEEFARELGRNPAGPQIDFSSQGDLPDVPGM